MLYIHQYSCISPQQTFEDIDLDKLHASEAGKLTVIEPAYPDIPLAVLRRMGKAVRIGVGAALPLLKSAGDVGAIILGTSNGGMEDCIKFLNQIMEYEEGTLTPTNFVQSTPNAIAAQIALQPPNTAYNITHVHRGLAFENAVLDAAMFIAENTGTTCLLGGLDEISTYNFNIEYLSGRYKSSGISNIGLYETETPGSIAGEGSAMFLVSGEEEGAVANLTGLGMMYTTDVKELKDYMHAFLDQLAANESIDLLLSGENGDYTLKEFYDTCESVLRKNTAVARYKHMTGEYATTSATGLFLAIQILQDQKIPSHMHKSGETGGKINNILIYNTYKGLQHSLMMVSVGSRQ